MQKGNPLPGLLVYVLHISVGRGISVNQLNEIK